MYSRTKGSHNKIRAEYSMKVLISAMIITIGFLVFFIAGNDTDTPIDTPISQQQSLDAHTTNDHEHTISEDTKTSSSKDGAQSGTPNTLYAQKESNNSDDNSTSYSQNNSSYAASGSSYNQDNSNYENSNASYSQNNTGYGNAGTSNSQNSSSYGSTSSTGSLSQSTSTNSTTNTDAANNDQDDVNSENAEAAEETDTAEEQKDIDNIKYQRLYDNGIMWYGNTGTLMVEYQSSDAQTTGIGFRVHYDSSAIKPVSVEQFPVDAIITTSPKTIMADTDNRDNDTNTDQFLPFAWASIYGQWPQTNQINLATIEFEKVDGGSTNYTVNYSAVSVPAGFRLIK